MKSLKMNHKIVFVQLFRVEDFGFGVDIMATEGKSWEERLAGEPDELTVDFVESLSIDKRL